MSSIEDKNVALGLLKALVENKYPFSFLKENEIYRKDFSGIAGLLYDILERTEKKDDTKVVLEFFETLRKSNSEGKPNSIKIPDEPISYWIEAVKKNQIESI
ncbi:MAG: hypothetical protein ACYSR1_01435 [Planctomycetota bacterium]|jgi:hypothetical protein